MSSLYQSKPVLILCGLMHALPHFLLGHLWRPERLIWRPWGVADCLHRPLQFRPVGDVSLTNQKGNSEMRSHHALIAAFSLFGLTIAVAQQPGRTPIQPTPQSEQTSPQQTIPPAQRPPERLSPTQLPREQRPELEQPESTE